MRIRMGFRHKAVILFVLIFVLMAVIGVLFVMSTWRQSLEEAGEVAIALAEAAESGISKTDLSEWLADDSPIDNPLYSEIKSNLVLLAHLKNDMRFAYIYINRQGILYIMADSEPVRSPDYSPPGQIYEEADDQYSLPFYTKKTVLTDRVVDRWGEWISVLVPMVNPDTGKVIAVLAVDYPAETWTEDAVKQMMRSALIAFSVFAIACAVLIVLIQNSILRRDKQVLAESDTRLRESERTKTIMLDNLPGMVYRCKYDRDWTMQFVSQGCYALTGYRAESLLDNRDLSFNDMIAPDYQELLWKKWERVVQMREVLQEEYQITTASGDKKWVWEQGSAVYDVSGEVIALEGLILDINDRKMNEMQLRYLNEHDPLTGLHNRRSLEEAIDRDLSDGFSGTRAVILVNLRRFNLINLTYGYLYGEKVIREMASCLSKLSEEIYHVSIDRFAFYIAESTDREGLEAFCSRIGEVMGESSLLGTTQVNAGVMEFRADVLCVEHVLQNTAIAAGNASDSHNFDYCFFSKGMQEKVERESRIKEELFRAATDPQDTSLYLEYQPIYDLGKEKIHGFEALARFHSEELGAVSPTEFIPIAEESQLIVPLGFRILRMACEFVGVLTCRGFGDTMVSVNVSVLQLLRDDFLPGLLQILDETGTKPAKLALEITESMHLLLNEEISVRLNFLRKLGIQIAIDDFGTGYSSLKRERELPVDCLKIDKYFIDKLDLIEHGQSITEDIISMAHKLGHYIIAEGVENDRQLRYLKEHHCDMIQGFLFSRPLPDEDALMLLEKDHEINFYM